MAEKRQHENSDLCEATSKRLKTFEVSEEMEDILLDSTDLSPDVKISQEYDTLLKTFSILLEKERKDGKRMICVGEEEIGNILRLLPALEKIASRYSAKRSPKLIDIPFEVSSGEIGDLVTVISVKENMYKRGEFDIDVRKCVKNEDGSYRYTFEGVRFCQALLTTFKETLLRYQTHIETATQKTKEVILMAAAYVVLRELSELTDCPGCKISHPSQKQHMQTGGCLHDEGKPTWKEMVERYWQAAWCLVEDEPVQKLAMAAVAVHEVSQKWFIPGLVAVEKLTENEVKELVLGRDSLSEKPLFKLFSSMEKDTA